MARKKGWTIFDAPEPGNKRGAVIEGQDPNDPEPTDEEKKQMDNNPDEVNVEDIPF